MSSAERSSPFRLDAGGAHCASLHASQGEPKVDAIRSKQPRPWHNGRVHLKTL